MSNLITLTCLSCGGQLEVANEAERYVCVHCGNAHIIDPGERAESLEKEVEQIRLKLDIRQAEDDLSVLRERQTALATQLNAQRDTRKMMLWLLWALPVAVVVIGLAEGAALGWTLLLTLFLMGFLFLITLLLKPSDSYQREKAN